MNQKSWKGPVKVFCHRNRDVWIFVDGSLKKISNDSLDLSEICFQPVVIVLGVVSLSNQHNSWVCCVVRTDRYDEGDMMNCEWIRPKL